MKIKQKLILSYLAISLVGTIASLLGIQNMNKVHKGFDRIANQTIPVKNELNELERSISNIIRCTNEFVFLNKNRGLFEKSKSKRDIKNDPSESLETKLQDEINEVKVDEQNYQKSLIRYKDLISLYFPEEKIYVERIEKSSDKVINTSKQIIGFEKNNLELQVFLKQRELDQNREIFSVAIQDALEHERIELEERKLSLHSTLKIADQETFIFSIFNVFLAITLGVFTSISVSRPIEKLKTVAIAIGKGKLESRTNFLSTDELGILAQTFNEMAEDLQQYIADIQQAKEYNSLLATALENVTDAIEITDREAKYLYVNPAFENITGYTKQEVLSQTPALLRSGKHNPDFYQEMLETVVRKQIWHGVLISKHKDGTLYDQEVTLSPIVNEAGLLTHIVGVKRDITQRKRMEAILREAERRWRTLLESVHLVVIGLNRSGEVEYANPFFLELSGYTHAEVMGKNWFEYFLPHPQRQSVEGYFLDILEGDFQTHYQNSILTKFGEEKIIAWNNTLLQTPQGEIIGTMSIGEDITERQAIARMKDEFISVVSHELRTPLAAIQGGLSLLASGLMSAQTDKGRRVIEIAAESVDHLVLLVNDILEVERLELGKLRLSKQSCNAAELMLKAQDQMQIMAKRAGITLSVSPQTILFKADPDRIIQVLTNLLGNAIKFSARDSTVYLNVALSEAEESLLFTVKDQGRGIPIENLDSIFERFHQVDASDSRKKGGTGLGLAICRSIVQQHGGRIWAESALGEGSSFFFSLPRLTTEDENNDNQENLGD